uniref:Uncharacterized protein n=1 Tax=Kalanchoe fedtschenkoi TaxID=63787 RepID=A0A7N0SWZ2_KALFE
MGQGKEVKTGDEPQVEIQERGEIFFFYRPKVAKEEAHSADDVQRMYIVLRPESGETAVEVKQDPRSGKEGTKQQEAESQGEGKKLQSEKETALKDPEHKGGQGSQEVNIEKQPLLRFIVMGQKSLPTPGKGKKRKKARSRPHWGFVELVTTNPEDVRNSLKGEEYDTATRGHRRKPEARAVGEGVYRILRHNPGKKMHTHLIYKLEFPAEGKGSEPQEALNIEREGSFLIQIKNPEQKGGSSSGFRGLQGKRKAVFPAKLQGQFGKLRYHPADPPDFLNYEGCEFLLISASDDIEKELGLDLEGEVGEEAGKSCSDLIKMLGEVASTKPLLEGTWV